MEGEKVGSGFEHMKVSISKVFKWGYPVRNMLQKPKGYEREMDGTGDWGTLSM